jgi:A/G-specific adenine glycosylase
MASFMPFYMSSVQHHGQGHGKKTGDISALLLAHYDAHARSLPWRMAQSDGLPDPYHVWLSEIMLQQTTVAAVIPYFERFKARWPDFAALAGANDADVMAAWAGLGYYARARNLLKCAREVVAQHNGQMPATETQLLKLPGVGHYTAAAIAAIAYGQRAVVMDANVERVVARLFVIGEALPAAKASIYAATDSITPMERSGDFAQAMMDLGAGYCSVRTPSCLSCPINEHCTAFQNGKADAYPVKAPKKQKPTRQGMAYWIERDDHVWLAQRGDKGMLAGMRALPDDRWAAQRDGDNMPPFDADWRILDIVVQHSFTHFHLEMQIAVTEAGGIAMDQGQGEYWPLKTLDKAGLPTLFSKAARAVMAEKL